jgi:catechol 2,3-dioxygenase-like lactoylglutathione lyase family enzyme
MADIRFLGARPNFHVRDIDVTVAFYRDLLGFDVVATMGEPKPFFGLVMREGAEIALAQNDDPQPVGCYVYVTGVDALHDRLTAAGAKITNPLTTQPWGNRDFVIADPDGHQIAIGERLT